MAKATKQQLDDLQGLTIEACKEALQDMIATGEWNPALINAAGKICKDNGIITTPENTSKLGDLAKVLPFDIKDAAEG